MKCRAEKGRWTEFGMGEKRAEEGGEQWLGRKGGGEVWVGFVL